MAKGLRSKSMRRNRAVKRETIFGPVETARLERLVQREAATESATAITTEGLATQEPTHQVSETVDERGRTRETEEAVATMDVDNEEKNQTESKPMTKAEKERLFMSRNAYKKKMKTRAKSMARQKLKLKRR
ncbi:hypothetical protein SpCBS45565_g05428 [Spizellomyces sp. 'palustris']|nr:hypothetical protein SpCBS45565_g05428 [Spizellomyces sp. 'palustris']